MKIRWCGHSYFFIQTQKENTKEERRIVIDPFSEEIGLKPCQVEADILLITHQHFDHNNKKVVKGEYFLIDGPGEYEIREVYIKGIFSYHNQKKEPNTIYLIEAEGIKICHLGDLGQSELTPQQIEEIGDIDVLMVPVGGVYTISAKEALKTINQIEPKIVIPMHYKLPKLKVKLARVEEFLKVIGQENVEPQTKLSIKKEKLPAQTTTLLLKPTKFVQK
ncbi:MAG: MBL fold metallo-hydrolase [Candidatus Pacebacteria bacterium]|nr:MBL fold metallo-hydrolase [Candidatus Paceibacterota bacterium]